MKQVESFYNVRLSSSDGAWRNSAGNIVFSLGPDQAGPAEFKEKVCPTPALDADMGAMRERESGLIDQSDKNVVLIFDVLQQSSPPLTSQNKRKSRSPYWCLFLINVFTWKEKNVFFYLLTLFVFDNGCPCPSVLHDYKWTE